MYNLLEYSDNSSMTSGGLWNYYKDEVNIDANENNDAKSYGINSNKTTTSKSFEHKTKIIGSTPANNNSLDSSRFDISRTVAMAVNPDANQPDQTAAATIINSATFQITKAKCYVAVVTF